MTRSTAPEVEEATWTVTNGEVRFSQVIIDPSVQRPINEAQVADIAKDFNPDALGTVTVSVRENGDWVLLDGQQRLNGAELAQYDGAVNCNFYKGLSRQQEAALFRRLNTRRPVSAPALFRVAVTEGEPQAVQIDQLLNVLGIRVGGTGGFNAISVARRVASWENGMVHLRWALDVCANVWGVEGKHLDGRIIEGLALLHHRDGAAIDVEILRAKLAGRKAGIPGILGEARTVQGLRGGRLVIAVVEVLIGTYNAHMRKNALPLWER